MEGLITANFPADEEELYTRSVRQVFRIEGVTYGRNAPRTPYQLTYHPGNGAPNDYLARYTGTLIAESSAAFDRLSSLLLSSHALPLFRRENNQEVIYLIPDQAIPHYGRSNPWINLMLFVLTVISVFFVGGESALQNFSGNMIQTIAAVISTGWPFAVSLLTILLVHEFGHYFAGRLHGLDVTLPYFIPMPFSVIGTMGAFINLRGIPKNRNTLLDVGISGPLAGLVVALILLWLGLKMSVLDTLPALVPHTMLGMQLEGNSIVYLAMKYLAFGKLLPQPASFHGIPEIYYWVKYFVTGQPLPAGGLDVSINGIAYAGWCGLLVTSLNLMPAGQLDGGHISFLFFGRKWVQRFYPFLVGATVLLGFVWSGWWLWAVLIYFFGRVYAEPLDQITPLSPVRRWLSILALVVFFLTFIPVPFNYY